MSLIDRQIHEDRHVEMKTARQKESYADGQNTVPRKMKRGRNILTNRQATRHTGIPASRCVGGLV